MEKKIAAKYFAFRLGEVVIIRRTVKQLQKVKSILRRPDAELALVQITVIGGRPIGTISYKEWCMRTTIKILNLQCVQITRLTVVSLKPFMYKGE